MGWGGASVAGAEGVLGAVDFLPAGLGLSAQGALVSAGGELMGARVYDPVVGGFLAPDPLEPVAGAGWAGASCAFAGNDPVNLVDPTGLQPITVEQMKQYFDYVKSGQIRRDALNQFWEDIKRNAARFIPSTVEDLQKFWEDFWRDPVAWMNSHPKEMENTGLVIIATALLFTPAAPLAAGFLSEMGFSWLEQRWSEGKIDPTRLQIDGAIGAGSAGVLGLGARLYRGLRAGRHINFETSFGRASLKDGTAVAGAQRASRGSSVVEVPALFAQGSERQAAWSQLRQSRYPKVKVEVRPVTGAGARSAVEVPPVAVSGVDGSRVASVQGSGVSRGGSQVPLRPVEAASVGEVRPVSGVGSGAAGVQAAKPGGVVDDAVVARGSAGGVRESGVSLRPVEEAKVEGLPPAKGAAGDSTALENPVTADRHVSWVEHPPGSKLQNGDQTATYLAGDDFKKTLVTSTKGSSRYVPAEEPGTYNVYGFDEARKLRDDYYKKLNGQHSPADLSKGEPRFALWRPEVSEPNLDTAMTGFRNVTRHGNTVEAQVGSHKFMVTNLDDYTGTIPDDVVPTAKSLYEDGKVYWKNKDHKPEGFGNVPDPLPFDNKEARILPMRDSAGNEIDYTKYRVRRRARVPNQMSAAGEERLIVGSDGSMYYTPDHYETFVRIF